MRRSLNIKFIPSISKDSNMHQEVEPEKQELICKVFKFSSGESIICMVTKETPSYIEVEMPYRLNMVYTPHGTVNLAIIKWDHALDYDLPIRVYKTSIVAVGDPDKEMYYHYSGLINSKPGDEEVEVSEEENGDENKELDSLMSKLLHTFKSDKMH